MIRVGTSGWRYAEWRSDFYPAGLRQRDELQFLSRRVQTIEINGSFYALQSPERYRRWAAETPSDFVFAVKGSRFITHMKKLKNVKEPLSTFMASGVRDLGKKLGPILWQFPESIPLDDRFEKFFRLLPKRHRHAVEIRSRCDDRFIELLKRHRIALVVADTAGRFPCDETVTSDFVYVRLHGERELYGGGYGKKSLKRWARKLRRWSRAGDVYVYFDNDRDGRAPYDAVRLIEEL